MNSYRCMRSKHVLLALPLALTAIAIDSVSVDAIARSRSTVAANSYTTGYPVSNATDDNYSTAWVSESCSSESVTSCASGAPTLAVGLGSYQYIDYVRFVPHTFNGIPQSVPWRVTVQIDNGSWNTVGTFDLDGDMSPSGVVLHFTRVNAQSVQIIATNNGVNKGLRADSYGGYYFQLAELYPGDSTVPEKTITFAGESFVCDSYADSGYTVLKNDTEHLTYDFSVTQKDSSNYIGVFHSEAMWQTPGGVGDSSAAVYASSPNSLFATRTFGSSAIGDYVTSRVANCDSKYMFGGSAGQANSCAGIGQGGNPVLIQRPLHSQSVPEWGLFHLSVTDLGDVPQDPSQPISGSNPRTWRHYLMLGQPSNVLSMTDTTWTTLYKNSGGSDDWKTWTNGSLARDTSGNRRSYDASTEPIPVREWTSAQLPVYSNSYSSGSGNTQGLIGNMSFDSGNSTLHFFYIDRDNSTGALYTARRDAPNDAYGVASFNYWNTPVSGLTWDAQKIAYHLGRSRWAVMSACTPDGVRDICLQFSSGSGVSTVTNVAKPDTSTVANLALDLRKWFRSYNLGVAGQINEQIGILKNGYGQIPSDEFWIYVPERTANAPDGGPINVYFGGEVTAIKVSCHAS